MQQKSFYTQDLMGWLVILFALAGLAGLGAEPAAAKTNASIGVNSTDETINPTDGKCTLREAITAANTDTASGGVAGECSAGSGADTIELTPNATYTLSVVDNTDPTLGANGLPVIVSDITVNGNNATIERSSADAIPEFRIVQVDASGILRLNALTLAGGDSTANGSGIYNAGTLMVTGGTLTRNRNAYDTGGGIYSTGIVEVHSSTFTENGAYLGYPTVYGGAIANDGGTLTIADSAFVNNTVLYGGGAVWSTGTVNIMASVFLSNTTQQNQIAGGAVSIAGSGTIADSLFAHNYARVYGGALFSEGSVTVERSTFWDNTADGSHGSGGGGAIYGSADITNTTFYQNHTGFYASVAAMQGSGTVVNSTFAENTDTGHITEPPALMGVTLKNSILFDTLCSNVTDGGGNLGSEASNSSCAGTIGNANLGALQDNGGSTETMLPAPNSPALEAAVDANCPPTDQRGITRPQGVHCDIGAVELEPPTAPTLTRPYNGQYIASNAVTLKWRKGLRAALYRIAVRDAHTGSLIARGKTTGTRFVTKSLPGGVSYSWTVTAVSKVGRTPSAARTFYVEP